MTDQAKEEVLLFRALLYTFTCELSDVDDGRKANNLEKASIGALVVGERGNIFGGIYGTR